MRELGYKGDIVSFEPLSFAYSQLSKHAEDDSKWRTVNIGLGSENKEMELHIAKSDASSSILDMLPTHEEAAPDSKYVGKEVISVKRMDSIFQDCCSQDDNVFLKTDTQGYEIEVLEGSAEVLSKITGLQMEMSLTPLYEGEALAETLIKKAREHGFVPMWLDHGFKKSAPQQLLQVDGLFFKEKHNIEAP